MNASLNSSPVVCDSFALSLQEQLQLKILALQAPRHAIAGNAYLPLSLQQAGNAWQDVDVPTVNDWEW